MNKEAIQENIKKMELELELMKKELNKPKGRWKPKSKDQYFHLSVAGGVSVLRNNSFFDEEVINFSEVFETREEAGQALELQTIENELCTLIEEINDGWFPNWDYNEVTNYFLSYQMERIHCSFWKHQKINKNKFYCKRNFLQDAIAKIGEERLIKYLKEC